MIEPVWIDKNLALSIHGRLLADHGGASGVRDEGLFESALARPCHKFAYGETDIPALSALYTVGIVSSQPFVDGNKRVGFVAGVLFLELNGGRFCATEAEATNAVFSLASDTRDEAAFVRWFSSNCT